MNTQLTTRAADMPIPMPDPREQRVLLRPPAPDYPETDATIAAAKQQQRIDRCVAAAEVDDPEDADEARMMVTLICERFTAERVHRWTRTLALIQDGKDYCERSGR